MYDCSTVIKLLDPYLDLELDVKESVRIQTHLRECPYCREMFSAEQAFQDLVRQNVAPPPAPEFARRCVTAALSRESRRPRLQRLRWRPARIAAGAGAVAAAAALVIVLVGEVHMVLPPPGTVGRPVPAIQTVGSGQAMVMAGGRLVLGEWHRDRLTDPLLLETTTGEPLAVPPGRAWISVFPSNRPIWSHS